MMRDTARDTTTLLRTRAGHILAAIALIWVAVQAVELGWRTWLHAQPAEWTFQYFAVDYLGLAGDGDGLQMVSELVRHRPADVTWNDVLRCESGDHPRPWPIWSTQHTSASLTGDTGGSVEQEWTFTAGYPTDGRACYMESRVAAEIQWGVTKSQTITSPDFVPGSTR